MELSYIAIDPGDRHIGLVLYENGKIVLMQFDSLENYTNIKMITNFLDEYINKQKIYTVIIENYINYSTKVNIKGYKKNDTSEVIGQLKQYFQMYWPKFKLVFQNASSAKIWDDQRLVRLGILEIKGNKFLLNGEVIKRHTRDALRHLIHYMNRNDFNQQINKRKFFNYE